MHTDSRLISTTAAHRRRRHMAVYHRALRAAATPDERAAVAARYRVLFTTTEDATVSTLPTQPVSADSVSAAA